MEGLTAPSGLLLLLPPPKVNAGAGDFAPNENSPAGAVVVAGLVKGLAELAGLAGELSVSRNSVGYNQHTRDMNLLKPLRKCKLTVLSPLRMCKSNKPLVTAHTYNYNKGFKYLH